MNEFYFDLQRFDDDIVVTTTSSHTFNAAGTYTFKINNNETVYSITLADNSSATISTDDNNSIMLKVDSGTVSNLTYTSDNKTLPAAVNLLAGSGTFQAYEKQNVTLGTQKVSFYFNVSGTSITPGPNTLKVTSNSDGSTEVIVNAPINSKDDWIEFSIGDFYYRDNGSGTSVADLELNIDSEGNYSFDIDTLSSNNEKRDIRYDSSNTKYILPTSGTITLGKNSDGVYVSALEKGDEFSTYGNNKSDKVTYKMGTSVLSATKDSKTKVYPGNASQLKILLSDLDFDTSTVLKDVLIITDNTLNITNEIITTNFTDNVTSLAVVAKDDDDDYSYGYGTLDKISDTSFQINQVSTDDAYDAINIESGYTVEFSSTITDATITVADTTVFSVTDTTENYSLTSGTSPLSVGGATGLSLTSGTLLTSTAAQTIAAGDYSVYGYNDSVTTNDGITIGLSNGSVIVGDIDTGESLSAYDTTAKATSNYTMLGTGLLKQTGDTYSIYRNSSTGGTFDGSLTLGSASDLLIAPDSGTLEIGTTNTQSGVVFDSESNPVSLYAELTKDTSGNYTLNTISGAVSDLTGWASTISITGSNTYTIHENFAGENVTIATNNSKTTFKVTATSSKTFTVSSGTDTAPTITGATAITLLNGSLTVTGTPTITMDGLNKNLTVTTNSGSGMTVNVTDSTATIKAKQGDIFKIGSDTFTVGSDTGMTITVTASGMTINAYGGDTFTVGGEKYTVEDGDGITFAVGSSGSVSTISDLATEGDSFTRVGTGYSVGGAGFIRGTSPSCSIWSDTVNSTHSLINNSVATDDLTLSSNWLGVTIVENQSISISPNSSISGLLIDKAFTNTYGTLTKQDSGYTLTKSSTADTILSNISIISSSDFNLTVDKDFTGINILAPNTSLSVNEATDDYQVSLTNGKTGLVNAKKATLTKGTLVADSNISSGVVVDGASVISGEEVTLTTDDNGTNASIDGLSIAEKITVNSQSYTFTGAGLRKGNALLRGTKANPNVDENPIALSSITNDNADWINMFNVSAGNGVTISSSTSAPVLLVDNFSDSEQPQSLYGELKTVDGGFALSTVDYYDAWNDNYTINIDNKTVTISSGFEGASIVASQTGAAFTVDSLDSTDNGFVVTDTKAGTGATLSGAKAITQTDGLIAVASSGIQSVTVGEYTIANSGNLSLDVSASGGTEATLSSLDEGENFNINSTGYSIISGLGLRTDNQFFKESSLTSSFKSTTLSELTKLDDTSEWIYIAAIKDDILTVPPTIDSSANEWLVLDDTKKTRYAQLTKDATSGVYSITKDTTDWDDKFTISVGTNETLNLTADFKDKKISGNSSGALFTVSDNSSYSVIDATGGASIGNATDISLSAGTISLSSANQTISGGDSVVSGNGTDIKVTVTDNKATISALATGDSFKVGDVTYTLLSNGRLQRGSDNSIWNGSTIKTDDSGSIAVASLGSDNWNGAISTDSTGNLTIDSAATAVLDNISSATAFIVNGDAPTSIYGSFTKDSDTYKLSTSGINTGVTLPAVTIIEDVGKLNFTKDLVNVSITAGSTTFTATKASSGYTVNYDSSELSVDDATAIDLTTGTLAIKNSTQLVTANNQSVQAVSDAVNVTYDSDGVTVDGITTAGESVKINDNTYTLATDTTGDGITVNIDSSGTTTIKDITVGDKFKIDDETFLYSSAGLTKTEANSDKISYVLKAIHPTSNELTLDDLQSTAEDIWLGIYLADSGNVTISSDIKNSVVLVDSVTNPTTNYGQVKLSDGTYTLQKYSDDDEALKAIADQIQNPTSITVEKGVTAVIDSVFSSSTTSIPVKANNATSITVTDSSGNSYVVGGTVDKFIPSTMTFTPAENDEFTVDGTTYLMTVAGLTKGNKIWTKANVTDYVLPDDDAWSAIVKLTTDNILDINKISPEEGSNIVVDNSSSTRWATLDYTAATDTTPATYSLKYIDSDKLAAVQLADGTATFTVNYVTTITTGNGTYTINDNDYTGSGLVVATTASTSTLQDGTVTLDSTTQAVTATNGGSISVTSGEITATASNGTWDTLNNLTEGDIFKIGDNTYKVYGSNTLAKLNSSGEPEKIYNSYITNGKLDYSKIVGDDYSAVIQLNSDDQLDLTKKLSVTSAIVVGQNDGTIDPTVRVAQIDYSETDDAYTLSETTDGVISTLKGVLLGTAVKYFNTTLETTVITSGIDTFTVNGNDFAALNALTIATASSNGAFLTNGKVTVAEGATVTTRYTDTSNHDTTITSTTGTLTVIADSTANTVTISDMDAGDVFNVGTNSYTMTSVGLTNGTKLNYNALKNSGITTAEFDLTDDAWKNIVSTDNGVLTITNAVGSNVFVADVDTTNPSSAVKYGTITKSSDDGIYTLTQADGNDTALEGIILTGVKVTFPTTCTNTNITAKGATFKVTASEPFTIDAASTTLGMSDEVTAVELTSGTLQATNGIPITASGNVITTTSGTMTVGIDDTGVFVGGLNEDETFTVGNTSYKKTAAGLLDVTNQKLRSAVTDTYYIGSSFDRIIEAPNGTLDLSNEKQSAEVYDSISAPTTHMASLTVSGGKLTLNEVDGGISTITLAKDATLTVNFAATVNGSGTTTVNSVAYDGTDLVIDATATSSTLQSGTVTIDSGESVQATKDSTALAVTSGSITATAADGRFTNIASLASGDIFTFNSKTYTQTAIGLVSSDNKLNDDVSTEVTVANLSGTAWQTIYQATSGALTINSSTGSDVVVVDITDDKAQSKRYGTLTKSGATYTLAQESTDSQLASITLDGVKASLPTTCANTTITANAATFTVTASELFTVNATSDIPTLSNVTAVELTSGTIQALNNIPITVGENVITTTSGTMTVGIDSTGVFVGNLNEDETFTVDGTSYKKTEAGLLDVTNQKLRAAVTDTYYLGSSFDRIIEAPSGALDLSNETQSAEVYDSISNPATHMASLTVSGGKLTLNEVDGGISTITLAENATLTVDFAATVNSSGNTTVNSVSYNGTNLVIDATATSSTLQSGTVTIDSGGTVKATKDSTALAVTDGSITATAANGRFTNIASLASGDIFTFNSKTYTQTAIGLVSSDNKINESVSTEVTIANLSGTAWRDIHQATSGALTINTSTGSDVLVVDITDDKSQSKRYGTLNKSGGTYTLTQADTDSQLASITLDGVKASLPTTCANTTITANEATFTVTATELFTVDATSDIPTLSNVTAITLNSGTIQALNNIPITIGDNVITTTSGTMTVGVDSTGVFVGGLNEDETFTVDGTSYKMTAAGLLDVTNQKLRSAVTDTYYIGSSFDRIIEAPSGVLDLSNETTSAEVYDSISNPATHMASLTVSGGKLTLNEVDGGISTITLAENATLTVDFAATVNSSGNTTVNSVSYNGTNLVIDATATSSTLQSGTVTIDNSNSVQATKDSTPLAVTSGSITATATNGYFTNIASLASGDIFTFNSKTYTQTAIGLVSSDNKINEDVSTAVTVANLSGTAWQDIHQATNGALTINTSTGSDVLVVDITNDKAQSKRYGTLTKSGVTYTLAQADTDSQLASITLDGVKASLPTTCANTTITANEAIFTVTASELFTVDATSDIPTLSNVTAITLNSGTIQALNNIPITVGDNVITTTSGTMTVGIDSTGIFVGGLNEDETFTVDGTSYKKTAAGLLDVTNQKLRAAVTDTYYIGSSFDRIIEAPSGALDLSNETTSAEVYDSISNPATHMATLTVSGGKLTLNEVDGGISTITLAENATLTVDFAATVNSSGTTTVNSNTYVGTTNLVIDATATSSTLQSGTVTIDNGNSVQATKDSTPLAVTSGSITATAASGYFTNIASLASGDIFTFNGKTYTQTAIGLVSSDNKINEDVSTEVTVANLSGTAWQDIHQATSGALTINTSTGSDVLVVDITNDKSQSKRYGTLTKSGVTYTLAQADTDSQLASITLDGVKASLPTTCANTAITANDATFTVTASEPFTVDATSDIPTLSNVTAITLNSGTIQALNNIPITVGENVITTTSGTMTVGIDSTGVFVGGLNEDETFTVDGTAYKMTAAGLLDVDNQKLRAAVTDTYYLGTSFDRIIETDGSTLDLSNETQSAEVYDSISNPATHMASLKVSGGKLTLSEVDGGISTITLAKDATLTVDFAATVNASGTTTVNSNTYAGTTDLVIDATATSSTLQSGTVTIDSGESVQATKDSTPLAVTSGSIDATATKGAFTTLTNVDAGDRFSFNDNSYIQSTLGLIKDSTISSELVTSTINISDLDSAKWLDFIAPSGGVLNLTNATVNALVLDSATAPTTKLADLTISNSRFNLKGANNPTSIEAVTLSENSNINVDFATQVYAPAGSVTVNSTTFDAASEVIIDSDGSTATLYEGTVNLDTTKPTVNVTNDSSTFKVLRGSLTVTVFDGLLVAVGELDTKDSFSFNDVTYTKTAIGLMKDDLISENLAGSTIELADIDTATWSNIIVPLNQTLDLTSATNALVCDDATNPTVKFATFTNSDGVLTLADDGDAADYIKSVDIATGTTLTVDFVTQVNAPSGSVIVNSKSYNGTSELVIQSDGTTSTLTSGTVTLNTGDSVATTNGNTISVSDGDGLTVTVGNNVTINGMNIGDAFKVDDNSYKVTESGLINTSGKFWTGSDFTDGLTVDALNLATNWTGIVVAKDGVLSVDSSTLANDETSTVVDDLSNPTITYGKLTKADDVYTLTKDADNTLSSIKVDSVKSDIDNNLAGVPLTITTPDGIKTSLNVTASAKFSNFTVDATGNNLTVDNVNAIEISAGKIELFDGQTITLAEDAQEVAIFAGNGTFNVGNETFTIADLGDNTLVEFDFDTDGNANSVIGFNKDSTVTIDGTTYTAPENNAILHYTEEDNWYFDGFAYDDYTVTVDTNGNVLVMPGVKFSNVISSGKTLSDDGTIKFAADYTKTPVTIVNQGKVALNINDADDNTLAENLSKHKNVTFNADGVETEDLTAVAGATFKLQDTKSLTAGDTKVTANDNDCEIGVGEDGTSISADKDATINAPADIALTLNAGDYNVNGADFTGSGTTSATTTADGVELNLANSDSIIYDSMTLSSAGTATIDNADGVTLSGGAKVANATNRALTVDGTAYLDDKTINTAKATEVTTTSAGVKVNRRNVKVSGDTDGYTVNIANLDIIGLENIGNSEGVTVDGLKNATIKTDKAGSLTAGNKTFIYSNDSVTYGLDNGSIVSISDAEQIIGDFSDKVSVNGDGIKLTGSTEVTLSADKNGVKKLELSEEGTYRVNNKTYEIEDEGGFAFDMSGGAVTGVESVENGSLIISQNESGFGVNDGIVTLTNNNNPVTLGIVDSNIVSVSGVDGTINGLENATVYGLSNAVINNKPLRISGSDEYTAIVADGVVNSIGGITDGAIISSAPNVTVTTAENGTFTFDSTEYKVNDTLDASVDFTTDGNSHVIEINNFAGEVSGVLEGVESLNGKTFNISGAGEVSVTSDGEEIVSITGITSGTTINGDVADMHYIMPEGKVTVNGIAYELEGDDNGALFVSNDGRALTGLDKDATLSVGAAGNYTINGTPFTVDAGDAFTVNRDGAYVIDPKNPPISEKTESADILARGENPVYVRPMATGNQTVDLTGDSNLALIDSANANVSVQAGAGNDSVVVRHDAAVDVNLDENGSTLIIPTAGKVTLENYNGDNAKVQTFDYSDVSGAIKSNEIKFGDGVMTMGDAIITYDTAATDTGSTTGKLINAHGKELAVGFTYQNGGLLDERTSNESYLMKGNYAEKSSDTQKGGGSSILTGSGNDTILAGAGDYIDAGGGYNQIYLTDKKMRNSVPEGATIVMNEGAYDTVSDFAGGFSGDDDKILIKNLSELGFGYGAGDLVMSAGSGQITFDNLSGNDHYELKLTDGTNEYKAAVAKADSVMAVDNSNEAEIFYGNENGISFSEYTGAVEVNLNENAGSLNGSAVQYYGLNKVTGGAGDTSLIGAANTPNTLTAGTGNGSIWSNSGKDLMVGNTDAGKSGTTTFFYMPGDGRDTITNFDFMSGTTDINADKIQLDDTSGVTDVFLNGNDVMIGINNGADDYLRLVDAKGKSFRFNDDLIAKVDTNVEFDGFTNCYVGIGNTPTLTVGEGMGDVEIWLSDDSLEYHGIWYDGNFAVLDASAATGRNILAGNEMNNLIIGGADENSIWGGYSSSNDTLVGGSGQNTFFFAPENGHDVIQNAHDGDLISLEDIYLDNIARADITGGGAVIELTDGSRLEVQSSAAIDYRLQDGTTYTADRRTGEWVQK